MHINDLGGRSYNDLTQYPVFPWILNKFSESSIDLDKVDNYRNLDKNMGSLGSEDRIKAFQERFETIDPFNPVASFHFGSHYSSPAIVLQYMIRISPFTEGAKEL